MSKVQPLLYIHFFFSTPTHQSPHLHCFQQKGTNMREPGKEQACAIIVCSKTTGIQSMSSQSRFIYIRLNRCCINLPWYLYFMFLLSARHATVNAIIRTSTAAAQIAMMSKTDQSPSESSSDVDSAASASGEIPKHDTKTFQNVNIFTNDHSRGNVPTSKLSIENLGKRQRYSSMKILCILFPYLENTKKNMPSKQ